jgi:hypothetical protein
VARIATAATAIASTVAAVATAVAAMEQATATLAAVAAIAGAAVASAVTTTARPAVTAVATIATMTGDRLGVRAQQGHTDHREKDRDAENQCTIHFQVPPQHTGSEKDVLNNGCRLTHRSRLTPLDGRQGKRSAFH